MVVNSNNYYKTEFALNDRNPETYNKTWYVRDTNSYSSNAPLTCCGLTKTDQQLTISTAMRYNNGPQSAANMVASYGVYQHTNQREEEDDDGFVPNSNNYRSAVVNSSGATTTYTRPNNDNMENEDTSCDWCLPPTQSSSTPSNEDSCWMSWCKPSILLVLLIILIVVFVLVAGILIYYNCMFTSRCMSVLFSCIYFS